WEGAGPADAPLVDAARDRLPTNDHGARARAYADAVGRGDLDAAARAAVALFDDDPVVPLWGWTLVWAAVRAHDAPLAAGRARQLAVAARYASANLWAIDPLERLAATGCRPR